MARRASPMPPCGSQVAIRDRRASRATGATLGEVHARGNTVMKGYLDNPAATDAAFDGRLVSLGRSRVWHPDGYIEIKDRSKDIIISGGENISSLEVEECLYRHPAGVKRRWSRGPTTSGARRRARSYA
jgi:acyl-CoA synthetase (AMP-forming)/AMP-acid ligase II